MLLLMSVSKSKFFTHVALMSFVWHSLGTRVVSVALALHLCRTRVSRVSHSCCTRVASVALGLHSCRSCCARVVRVWHSYCKLD